MRPIEGNLAAEERLRWLTERLVGTGSLAIADAAADLGVSEMTIRRDLAELEERGTARRVRRRASRRSCSSSCPRTARSRSMRRPRSCGWRRRSPVRKI
jgi:DeoR/GlpR family transcriptional regulator of sugar metabolism